MQETQVWPLLWEDSACHGATNSCPTTIELVLWSLDTVTAEPTHYSCWSPQAAELVLRTKGGLHRERPVQCSWRVAPPATTGGACVPSAGECACVPQSVFTAAQSEQWATRARRADKQQSWHSVPFHSAAKVYVPFTAPILPGRQWRKVPQSIWEKRGPEGVFQEQEQDEHRLLEGKPVRVLCGLRETGPARARCGGYGTGRWWGQSRGGSERTGNT